MCNQCHLLQEGRTGINPMSCVLHLTLLTLITNLNFSKGPGNQFVLEMFRPLRPPFDSFKIPIDYSNLQSPSHICCSLSLDYWI